MLMIKAVVKSDMIGITITFKFWILRTPNLSLKFGHPINPSIWGKPLTAWATAVHGLVLLESDYRFVQSHHLARAQVARV